MERVNHVIENILQALFLYAGRGLLKGFEQLLAPTAGKDILPHRFSLRVIGIDHLELHGNSQFTRKSLGHTDNETIHGANDGAMNMVKEQPQEPGEFMLVKAGHCKLAGQFGGPSRLAAARQRHLTIRSKISPAAFLVKVSAQIRSGVICESLPASN